MRLKTKVVIGSLVALGMSAVGYNLWQPGRIPGAADSVRAGQPAEPQAFGDDPLEEATVAVTPVPSTASGSRVVDDLRDPHRTSRFDTLPPGDETPDDRAAIEALLDDPDPDVRGEAAALLALLDEELYSSEQ